MFNYVMSHVAFFQKQSPRAEAICKYQENFRFSFIETLLLHGCSPVNLLHICRAPFSKNFPGELLLSLNVSIFIK